MRPFPCVLPLLLLVLAASGCGTASTAAKPASPLETAPPAGESAPGAGVSLGGGTSLEVVGIRLAHGGSLLGVGYRLKGAEALNFGDMYVIDEATGAKYTVARVAKIGHLAPQRIKDLDVPSLYTMFDTNYHVKAGAKVTVVINGMMVEHLEVMP
jgi:hypothetical protein